MFTLRYSDSRNLCPFDSQACSRITGHSWPHTHTHDPHTHTWPGSLSWNGILWMFEWHITIFTSMPDGRCSLQPPPVMYVVDLCNHGDSRQAAHRGFKRVHSHGCLSVCFMEYLRTFSSFFVCENVWEKRQRQHIGSECKSVWFRVRLVCALECKCTSGCCEKKMGT